VKRVDEDPELQAWGLVRVVHQISQAAPRLWGAGASAAGRPTGSRS
jgi:hypothetical protein